MYVNTLVRVVKNIQVRTKFKNNLMTFTKVKTEINFVTKKRHAYGKLTQKKSLPCQFNVQFTLRKTIYLK